MDGHTVVNILRRFAFPKMARNAKSVAHIYGKILQCRRESIWFGFQGLQRADNTAGASDRLPHQFTYGDNFALARRIMAGNLALEALHKQADAGKLLAQSVAHVPAEFAELDLAGVECHLGQRIRRLGAFMAARRHRPRPRPGYAIHQLLLH
ncbi:MAG: hypothetical protein ABSH22_15840 [Tepidisphaeraceae bacterium]